MRAIQDPADAAKFAALVIRRHLPDPAYRIFLFGSRASGVGGRALGYRRRHRGTGSGAACGSGGRSTTSSRRPRLFLRSMSSISGVCGKNFRQSARNSASGCGKISIAASRLRARRDFVPGRGPRAPQGPDRAGFRDFSGSRFRLSCAGNSSKAYLEEQHNAVCTSPRTCFRSAFSHGVISTTIRSGSI